MRRISLSQLNFGKNFKIKWYNRNVDEHIKQANNVLIETSDPYEYEEKITKQMYFNGIVVDPDID